MKTATIQLTKHYIFQENESLPDFIQNQIKFYSDRQLTCRPFVVVQGHLRGERSSEQVTEQAFVVVHNVIYAFHSVLRAVDVCFKIIKSLGCDFSYDSKYAWTFLEKYLYGIDSENVPLASKQFHCTLLQVEKIEASQVSNVPPLHNQHIAPTFTSMQRPSSSQPIGFPTQMPWSSQSTSPSTPNSVQTYCLQPSNVRVSISM